MRHQTLMAGVVAVLPLAACGCGKAEAEANVAVPGGSIDLKPGVDGGVTAERVIGVRGKWGSIDWNPGTGEVGFSPLWIPLALTVNAAGEAKLEFAVAVGSRGPVGAKVKWELGRTEGYGTKQSRPEPKIGEFLNPGSPLLKTDLLKPNPASGLGRPKPPERFFPAGK